MRVIFAMTAAGMLAACGGPADGTYETEDGTVEVDGGMSGENPEVRFTSKDGEETVVHTGGNVVVDLPDGFAIYPGAQVVSNTSMTSAEGAGAMVVMTSDADPEAMVAHYRKQAEAAGVNIEMEMNSNGTLMIAGELPEGGAFSFTAMPAEDGSQGTLLIGTE